MGKLKGLGDLVYLVTKYTGIRWIVKKLWGEDCGCDERQEEWNNAVPFTSKPKDISIYNKPKPTPKL